MFCGFIKLCVIAPLHAYLVRVPRGCRAARRPGARRCRCCSSSTTCTASASPPATPPSGEAWTLRAPPVLLGLVWCVCVWHSARRWRVQNSTMPTALHRLQLLYSSRLHLPVTLSTGAAAPRWVKGAFEEGPDGSAAAALAPLSVLDAARASLDANTAAHCEGRPAYHALVAGPSGSGKSSLLWDYTLAAGETGAGLAGSIGGLRSCRFGKEGKAKDCNGLQRRCVEPSDETTLSPVVVGRAPVTRPKPTTPVCSPQPSWQPSTSGKDRGLRLVDVSGAELSNILEVARGCGRYPRLRFVLVADHVDFPVRGAAAAELCSGLSGSGPSGWPANTLLVSAGSGGVGGIRRGGR
mgnify:CR=1 FL=1